MAFFTTSENKQERMRAERLIVRQRVPPPLNTHTYVVTHAMHFTVVCVYPIKVYLKIVLGTNSDER